MFVASDKAVTLGATAVIDPVTEAQSDLWFQYMPFACGIKLSASGIAIDAWTHYPFDSRAQRKVEEGQDIAIMVANASADDGLFYILNFRMLIKLA